MKLWERSEIFRFYPSDSIDLISTIYKSQKSDSFGENYEEWQYNLFLTKLNLMGKIEAIDYDREFGKFYGYPKCCVDNFIDVQKKGCRCVFIYMLEEHKHPYNLDLNYVFCPSCIKKYRNKMSIFDKMRDKISRHNFLEYIRKDCEKYEKAKALSETV